MKVKSPVMRYHGGKWRMAKWTMQFFPSHNTYVEPFGGAAGILLQKKPSMSEVYNDLDGDVSNVFSVLQDKELSEELQLLLLLTPYSRREFDQAYEEILDPVKRAKNTLVRAFMGFGSAGATKGVTGFRIDSARKYGTSAQLWAKYPPKIQMFHERLQGVVIENRPAGQVIENHDRPDTLFYVDPPYLASTRARGNPGRTYSHEMSDSDHEKLIEKLSTAKGLVVLSGYNSELYSDLLKGWQKHSTIARISAGRGTAVREECVWLNPACVKGQAQMNMWS